MVSHSLYDISIAVQKVCKSCFLLFGGYLLNVYIVELILSFYLIVRFLSLNSSCCILVRCLLTISPNFHVVCIGEGIKDFLQSN